MDLFRARGMQPGRWSIAREAGVFHLAAASGDRTLGEDRDCSPDNPVILTVEGTHGPIIHAVTKAAAERGARVGARLTDARALDPALVAVPADPAGDAALLQRLAKWTSRWSPLVEVDGPDGLRLDVSGVAHLFGGEPGLVRGCSAMFRPRVGSWHASRLRRQPRRPGRWFIMIPAFAAMISQERLRAAAHLCTAPRCGHGAHARAAWASRRSAHFLAMPRLALARRFRGAEDVVDALDRALGQEARAADRRAGEPAAASGATHGGAGDAS